MAYDGQGCSRAKLASPKVILVVSSGVIHRSLISSAAKQRSESNVMVQIHRNRAFMRSRATHRLSPFPKDLPSTKQAFATVHFMRLPWTCTQPARTHVPGSVDEKNLRFPTRAIHRNGLPGPDATFAACAAHHTTLAKHRPTDSTAIDERQRQHH
eukprot:508184-Pleurochrysis_carterae.AAC.1